MAFIMFSFIFLKILEGDVGGTFRLSCIYNI